MEKAFKFQFETETVNVQRIRNSNDVTIWMFSLKDDLRRKYSGKLKLNRLLPDACRCNDYGAGVLEAFDCIHIAAFG